MVSVLIRLVCILFWLSALAMGSVAVERGDWRLLVAQIAQALIAVVLWFAMPPGGDRLRPPGFGTRALRLTLYAGALLTSLVAFVPWQWPPGDIVSLRDSTLLLFGVVLIAPFIEAERRGDISQ